MFFSTCQKNSSSTVNTDQHVSALISKKLLMISSKKHTLKFSLLMIIAIRPCLVNQTRMELETWGFKFLSLLFGECFKGKELETPKFQVPLKLSRTWTLPFLRGIKFPTLRDQFYYFFLKENWLHSTCCVRVSHLHHFPPPWFLLISTQTLELCFSCCCTTIDRRPPPSLTVGRQATVVVPPSVVVVHHWQQVIRQSTDVAPPPPRLPPSTLRRRPWQSAAGHQRRCSLPLGTPRSTLTTPHLYEFFLFIFGFNSRTTHW